ncbi:MAG: TonB-dependent receptor [Bacteroidetes Order II. Incertae sedis bacterium]|nr:TonB-dependent receptor [Bacteroidetes Order II. bacterium]
MRRTFFLLLVFWGVFIALPLAIQAQGLRIVGAVYDASTGLPLKARVFLQPGGQSIYTDERGNYTFSRIRAGNYTLSVNLPSYDPASKTVTVKTADILVDIGLRPIGKVSLSDVPMKPRETANPDIRLVPRPSMPPPSPPMQPTTPDADPVYAIPSPSFVYFSVAQRLQASCPDLWVMPSSGSQSSGLFMAFRNGGGLTATAPPLVFIDGIRLENEEYRFLELGGERVSALTDLKTEDIEEVTCLAGPAASARLGVSAGAGAILLTTRSGKSGETRASYHTDLGQHRLASPFDFSTASNPDVANTGLRNGSIVRHNLRFEGGRDETQYFASGYVGRSDGAMLNDGLRERGARLHLVTQPFPTLRLTAMLAHGQAETGSPQGGASVYGYLLNTTGTNAPYGLADSSLIRRFTTLHEQRRTLAHINVQLEPIPHVFIRGKMGYEGTDLQGEQNRPPNARVGIGLVRRAVISRKSAAFTYEASLRHVYDKPGVFSLSTEAGIRAFDVNAYHLLITKDGFTEGDPTNVGTGRDVIANEEARTGQREMGIFIQEDVTWRSGMRLRLGLAYDDADRIGKEVKWVVFPYARLTYPLNLSFLPKSQSSIYLSYGEAGNLPNALDARGTFWVSVPGGFGNGWVVSSVGNDVLKPERMRELELGFINKWLDKLDFYALIYRQHITDGVVYALPVPSSGLGNVLLPQNGGASVGYGVVARVTSALFRSSEAGIRLTMGLHGQRNRVETLGNTPDIYDANKLNVIKPGLARLSFYAPVVVAAAFDPLTQKYLHPVTTAPGTTYNGKTVDANGNAFLGNAQPAWTSVLELNAQWRNWQMGATVEGAQGVSVYNGSRHFRISENGDQAINIARAQIGLAVRNDVTPLLPGTETYNQAALRVAQADPNFAGNFVERADYIRLSAVQLRYNHTRLHAKRGEGHLKRLTLGLQVTHLGLFSRYSGADPTVRTFGARTYSWGQERFTIPQNRRILFSVGLGL